MHKTAVRPALLYVALRKTQEAGLEVADTNMLRFSLCRTRMDKIKNE